MFYKAQDPVWSKIASQGGIVRGCAHWLLTNGYIKSVIGVINGEQPSEYKWGITDDPANLAKSVYKLMDPHDFLESLSEEEKGESLFIGTPCQIANGVKYRITIFCSGHTRGNQDKDIVDFRYGIKPGNFGILYADGTYDNESDVPIGHLKPNCPKCKLEYSGDMVVGDLHGTPYNLVETQNPLFDSYVKTTRYKEITKGMYSFLIIDNKE